MLAADSIVPGDGFFEIGLNACQHRQQILPLLGIESLDRDFREAADFFSDHDVDFFPLGGQHQLDLAAVGIVFQAGQQSMLTEAANHLRELTSILGHFFRHVAQRGAGMPRKVTQKLSLKVRQFISAVAQDPEDSGANQVRHMMNRLKYLLRLAEGFVFDIVK